MKKITLLAVATLTVLSLAGCSKSSKPVHHHATKTELVAKKKAKKEAAEKAKKKKQAEKKKKAEQKAKLAKQKQAKLAAQKAAANQQAQQNQQLQSNQGQQHLTQGQINQQRGYDPAGAPIMPGSDHAPGANPDGTPDAWVQGQNEWAIQQGYENPDGTETEKGKELEQGIN